MTTQESTETIGRRIRRLRLERNFSQRDLECDGVTFAYISRIESGDRDASMKALIKIADKLNVPALYLLTGAEPRNNPDVTCPLCLREAA